MVCSKEVRDISLRIHSIEEMSKYGYDCSSMVEDRSTPISFSLLRFLTQ